MSTISNCLSSAAVAEIHALRQALRAEIEKLMAENKVLAVRNDGLVERAEKAEAELHDANSKLAAVMCPGCGHSVLEHALTSRIVGCQAGDGSDANPICGCRLLPPEMPAVAWWKNKAEKAEAERDSLARLVCGADGICLLRPGHSGGHCGLAEPPEARYLDEIQQLRAEVERLRAIEEAAKAWLDDVEHIALTADGDIRRAAAAWIMNVLRTILAGRKPGEAK